VPLRRRRAVKNRHGLSRLGSKARRCRICRRQRTGRTFLLRVAGAFL
jgi:hypothetical protein